MSQLTCHRLHPETYRFRLFLLPSSHIVTNTNQSPPRFFPTTQQRNKQTHTYICSIAIHLCHTHQFLTNNLTDYKNLRRPPLKSPLYSTSISADVACSTCLRRIPINSIQNTYQHSNRGISITMALLSNQNLNSSSIYGEDAVARVNVLASCYIVDSTAQLKGTHYCTTGVAGMLLPGVGPAAHSKSTT